MSETTDALEQMECGVDELAPEPLEQLAKQTARDIWGVRPDKQEEIILAALKQSSKCASCGGFATTCHECLCAACDDARASGVKEAKDTNA